MILTGSEIVREYRNGMIGISPFSDLQVNPNSYNYRLGTVLKEFSHFQDNQSIFKEIVIPPEGFVLKPQQMYLSNTLESIGSSKYAMSLIGRSSLGRLGLFLQLSANLGHVTSNHRWTLELMAVKPFRIYAGMIIGQVSFWQNFGEISPYIGVYGKFSHPQESVSNGNV